MRRVAGPAVAWAAALLLAASPARACSVVSGYRVPGALELAARADLIVLATVTGERTAESVWDRAVLLRPTVLLKGRVLPAKLELAGAYLAPGEPRRYGVTPSDPRELRRPNPGALSGGCVRYVFAAGMQLLLFLERGPDGRLQPIREPFSRDAEDVAGPDALWVRAVREYAAVAAAPASGRVRRLRSRAAALRASRRPDDLLLARDLDIEAANAAGGLSRPAGAAPPRSGSGSGR